MFKSEAEFQEWLVQLPNVHWTHLDPRTHGTGYPDLSYCYDSMEGHIELKWKPGIRSTQRSWFRTRVAHGGRPMLWWSPEWENMIYIFAGETVVNYLVHTSSAKAWRKHSDGQIDLSASRLGPEITNDIYYNLRYPFKRSKGRRREG